MRIERGCDIRNASELCNGAFPQKAYRGVDCKNNSFHDVRIPKMEGENFWDQGGSNDESLQILSV